MRSGQEGEQGDKEAKYCLSLSARLPLITESTHRLACAILEVEPQPAMAFKGKADAVHTHILKSVNGVDGFPC